MISEANKRRWKNGGVLFGVIVGGATIGGLGLMIGQQKSDNARECLMADTARLNKHVIQLQIDSIDCLTEKLRLASLIGSEKVSQSFRSENRRVVDGNNGPQPENNDSYWKRKYDLAISETEQQRVYISVLTKKTLKQAKEISDYQSQIGLLTTQLETAYEAIINSSGTEKKEHEKEFEDLIAKMNELNSFFSMSDTGKEAARQAQSAQRRADSLQAEADFANKGWENERKARTQDSIRFAQMTSRQCYDEGMNHLGSLRDTKKLAGMNNSLKRQEVRKALNAFEQAKAKGIDCDKEIMEIRQAYAKYL